MPTEKDTKESLKNLYFAAIDHFALMLELIPQNVPIDYNVQHLLSARGWAMVSLALQNAIQSHNNNNQITEAIKTLTSLEPQAEKTETPN